MAKTKRPAAAYPVAQTREEAATCLQRIGEAQREITRIELQLADDIAALKLSAEHLALPLREAASGLTAGLQTWAEVNRERLTNGGTVKFADLGTGRISWRQRPPSVTIRNAAAAIEALQARGYTQLIRVKTEINREAILAAPLLVKGLAGITVGSAGEDFVVEPIDAVVAQQPAA